MVINSPVLNLLTDQIKQLPQVSLDLNVTWGIDIVLHFNIYLHRTCFTNPCWPHHLSFSIVWRSVVSCWYMMSLFLLEMSKFIIMSPNFLMNISSYTVNSVGFNSFNRLLPCFSLCFSIQWFVETADFSTYFIFLKCSFAQFSNFSLLFLHIIFHNYYKLFCKFFMLFLLFSVKVMLCSLENLTEFVKIRGMFFK